MAGDHVRVAWCAAAAAAKLRWAAGRVAAQAYVDGDHRDRGAAWLALLAESIAANAPACGCGGGAALHVEPRRRA